MTREVIVREDADEGFYQNHVQSDRVRLQIEEGFDFVRRIQSTATYRTYHYYNDNLPTKAELENAGLEDSAALIKVNDHSTAGTAIIISNNRGRLALLTAAHTVSYPDTIWHYAEKPSRGSDSGNSPVKAVSVRDMLHQFVFLESDIALIESVVLDDSKDLAVMRSRSTDRNLEDMSPVTLPAGDVGSVKTGDRFYALGFPKGVRMVTQGSISRSGKSNRSIVLDMPMNRGFSGGAVFAVRSDGSGLQWIGMITSAMGDQVTMLTPGDRPVADYDPELPYEGELFISTQTRIFYGITWSVDIDQIREFLLSNFDTFNEHNIDMPEFVDEKE